MAKYNDSGRINSRDNTRRRADARTPARPSVRRENTDSGSMPRSRRRPAPRPVPRPASRNAGPPPTRRPVKRRRPVKKTLSLRFLEFLRRAADALGKSYLRFKKTPQFRTVSVVCIGILIVLSALITIFFITRPNAFSIYLNDEHIGTVRQEGRRNITPEYIETHTTARLEGQLGSSVFISDEISAEHIRIGRNAVSLTFDNLVTNIINALDYYVQGAVILVNGTEAANLPSLDDAEELLRQIVRLYHDDLEGIEYEFAEDVAIAEQYIHKSELMTFNNAFDTLTSNRPVQEVHVVRSGENLSIIAEQTGMGMTALLAANPNVDPNVFLQVGQLLLVTRSIPLLSVISIKQDVIEEVLPPPVEFVQTTSLSPGQSRTMRQGENGLQVITAVITQINGTEVSREILSSEVIVPPVSEIVHVGVAG